MKSVVTPEIGEPLPKALANELGILGRVTAA
jgi:hypothetical protein